MTMGNQPTSQTALEDAADLTIDGKLMVAISVLQLHSLAAASVEDGRAQWGVFHMPMAGIDHVIGLLIDLLEGVEVLSSSRKQETEVAKEDALDAVSLRGAGAA